MTEAIGTLFQSNGNGGDAPRVFVRDLRDGQAVDAVFLVKERSLRKKRNGDDLSHSERYLWQRAGPPDPQVERLERALAALRYRGKAPELSERAAPARARALWPLALAAVLLLVASVAWLLVRIPAAGWDVRGFDINSERLSLAGQRGIAKASGLEDAIAGAQLPVQPMEWPLSSRYVKCWRV